MTLESVWPSRRDRRPVSAQQALASIDELRAASSSSSSQSDLELLAMVTVCCESVKPSVSTKLAGEKMFRKLLECIKAASKATLPITIVGRFLSVLNLVSEPTQGEILRFLTIVDRLPEQLYTVVFTRIFIEATCVDAVNLLLHVTKQKQHATTFRAKRLSRLCETMKKSQSKQGIQSLLQVYVHYNPECRRYAAKMTTTTSASNALHPSKRPRLDPVHRLSAPPTYDHTNILEMLRNKDLQLRLMILGDATPETKRLQTLLQMEWNKAFRPPYKTKTEQRALLTHLFMFLERTMTTMQIRVSMSLDDDLLLRLLPFQSPCSFEDFEIDLLKPQLEPHLLYGSATRQYRIFGMLSNLISRWGRLVDWPEEDIDKAETMRLLIRWTEERLLKAFLTAPHELLYVSVFELYESILGLQDHISRSCPSPSLCYRLLLSATPLGIDYVCTLLEPYRPYFQKLEEVYEKDDSVQREIKIYNGLVSDARSLLASPTTFDIDSLLFSMLRQETKDILCESINQVFDALSVTHGAVFCGFQGRQSDDASRVLASLERAGLTGIQGFLTKDDGSEMIID